MAGIKSLDELKALRDKYKSSVGMRSNIDEENKVRIAVGMATCGIASGARETINAIADEVRSQGLENVSVVQTGCLGYCSASAARIWLLRRHSKPMDTANAMPGTASSTSRR